MPGLGPLRGKPAESGFKVTFLTEELRSMQEDRGDGKVACNHCGKLYSFIKRQETGEKESDRNSYSGTSFSVTLQPI